MNDKRILGNIENSPRNENAYKSPDLSIHSEIFVKNFSEKDNINSENVNIQIEDECRNNDEILQQKEKSRGGQDIIEISIDGKDDVTEIQENKINEKRSLLNEISNNDDAKYLKRKSQHHKDIIELPVPRPDNTVNFQDFTTQDGEINETTKKARYSNVYKKRQDNLNQARGLATFLPWPSSPDERVPEGIVYDPKTRNDFIKCVLIIVLIMIIITSMFIVYVLITPAVKLLCNKHGWEILLPALMLLIIADCGMICSTCAKRPPCNVIFLIMTVLAMSFIAARISAFYNTEVVLYATISTGVVVLACILLACSSFDFTNWILYIVVISIACAVIATIVYAIAIITGQVMRPLIIAILYISTIFQVVMLTIQLQMIIGKKSIEIGVEDYTLAAFFLYTSILDIFIRSVHIIGLSMK